MRKQIRAQILKMFMVVLALCGLVGWQFDFVWSGITSNVYLNMTIIGMFFFGLFLSFQSVFSLGNEVTAFGCLKEAYDDVRFYESRATSDPYWRHFRCLEPAIVFHKPKLLGHAFALTYEKVMRNGDLRITIGTMQSLVSELNSKLSDDRSLFQYVTGLLVFLGLIGTFIGLMNMVGSVGGIIGGLAEMDPSSGDALMQLINDLKEPLVGMATGFSSSLFGLFGSLVLGLIGRFMNIATGVLKGEFEGWLAQIAELEVDNDDEALTPEEMVTLISQEMKHIASSVSRSLESQERSFDHLQHKIDQSSDVQFKQLEALERISQHLSVEKPAIEQSQSLNLSSFEEAMKKNMQDMSRSMEQAFISYASLLKQNLASKDQKIESSPSHISSDQKGNVS